MTVHIASGAGVARDGFLYEPSYREIVPGDPANWFTTPKGERLPIVGHKLADLIAEHGWEVPVEARTDSGEIIPLRLSLEPFRSRDPQTTYLTVGWRETPLDRPLYCTPEGPIVP